MSSTRGRRWWISFWLGFLLFVTVCVLAVQSALGPLQSTSDSFWRPLHIVGAQYKWFSSLDEMAREASVVVLGRIVSVEPGRVIVPEPQHAERASAYYLNAAVEIDAVLHGELAGGSADNITVELFAPNPEAIPFIIGRVPTEQAVFFLLNKAVHPATAYLSPVERASEGRYYEIIGSQAVLTSVDGKVQVREDVPQGEFPRGLNQTSFQELVASIRRLP